MIFPAGILKNHWKEYPWTWCLLALNICVHFIFTLDAQMQEKKFTVPAQKDLEVIGHIYSQYLADKMTPKWEQYFSYRDHPSFYDSLGEKALRDADFVTAYSEDQFAIVRGDKIRAKQLQSMAADFRKNLLASTMHRFGVSKERHGIEFLTYQFVHYDFWHLLNNMILLVLAGFIVESLIGWQLLPLYFLSGIGGALFYIKETGAELPLVGASAAITGILGYILVIQPRRILRFFYFFSPFQNHYGYVFLPVWVLIPISLISDIVGWSSQAGLGFESVGYTAHLGGWIAGACTALITHSLSFSKYRTALPRNETRS